MHEDARSWMAHHATVRAILDRHLCANASPLVHGNIDFLEHGARGFASRGAHVRGFSGCFRPDREACQIGGKFLLMMLENGIGLGLLTGINARDRHNLHQVDNRAPAVLVELVLQHEVWRMASAAVCAENVFDARIFRRGFRQAASISSPGSCRQRVSKSVICESFKSWRL